MPSGGQAWQGQRHGRPQEEQAHKLVPGMAGFAVPALSGEEIGNMAAGVACPGPVEAFADTAANIARHWSGRRAEDMAAGIACHGLEEVFAEVAANIACH